MEFVKLIPINRICPCCGNGNYMRIISGKYVGALNVKCINCNSYYNYDELLKRDNSKPMNGADGRTMADLISRAAARDIIADLHGLCRNDVLHDTLAKIDSITAVDAVPVVRCRDCKWGIVTTDEDCEHIIAYCNNPDCPVWEADIAVPHDWYCANGKWRETDGTD